MGPIPRRDILLGLGGGLCGAMLTPVPWRLLDDVSIWTQHRRALPIPPAGERSVRASVCTLCPGGCALRVHCVGGRPVFASGQRAHPLGGGVCAFGLTLHHLAHHPLRLDTPVRLDAQGHAERVPQRAALAMLMQALTQASRRGQDVLVVDQRPGRVVSLAYREFLAGLPRGIYAVPDGEDATLAALAGAPQPALGIDLERTGTLLSFGAPVLEGWGQPGRMLAARARLRVVQLDTWRSPSAALADEWLAIRPGSEGLLALALAQVLTVSGRVPPPAPAVQRLLADFAPARVAPLAELAADRIEQLAHTLVAHGPTVALGGGQPGAGPLAQNVERAIALLNVVLGSVGRPGGIVARPELPDAAPASLVPAQRLADVADGQAGVLLIDAADAGRTLPWAALERKLASGALVVSLQAFLSGLARHAHIVLPAPAPLETYDEALPAGDSAVASYALAAPLLPTRPGATEPVELLGRLSEGAGLATPFEASLERRLRRRVAAIHASGRGRLLARNGDTFVPVPAADADALWKALADGGCWVDDTGPRVAPDPATASVPSVAGWMEAPAPDARLALVAFAARGAAGGVPAAPVLTKLYQETDLRPGVSSAAIHPQTARAQGLADGSRVLLESAAGRATVTLRCDPSLPPGRIALAAGPEPAALYGLRDAPPAAALVLSVVAPDLTWRATRVSIHEA